VRPFEIEVLFSARARQDSEAVYCNSGRLSPY